MGADKRHPRGFEPPPWEREQFEELEQRRTEQGPAPEEVPAEEAPEPSAEQPAEADTPSPAAPESEAEPASDAKGDAGPGGEIDEAKANELLAGLRAEEPTSAQFRWAGIAGAVFLGMIGAVLMIWGMGALQATQGKGTQGWLGAAGTIIFGAGFIAIAGWVVYKNLQRQGVL